MECALLDLFHSLCTENISGSKQINKDKILSKKIFFPHDPDSHRYNIFFSYNQSAVVFIKSIEIYFPLCFVESSPRLYGDQEDVSPNYDRTRLCILSNDYVHTSFFTIVKNHGKQWKSFFHFKLRKATQVIVSAQFNFEVLIQDFNSRTRA